MNKNRQIRKPGGEYLEVIAESNQIDGGSKERPLSAVSDEYVEIHDDIRSHASIEPLHTSPGESYDGYLKNPKEQGHRVTIQDNCAYNATVQIREETAISGRGRVIQSNSLYEEIPDRAAVESGISQATVSQPRVDAEGQKESKKIISPGEALWSFWQGKAEIAIRITNLALGAVIFLLLFAIIVNAGRIYGTSLGTDLSARYTPTPTFATIASWMLMLTFAGTTEVFLFIARVYVTKATKCIMIWDIVHSVILYVVYLILCFQMIWLATDWTILLPIPQATAEINGEIGLLATCSILGFAYAGSYMLKASWLIAFIRQNWEKKMDKYRVQSQ